MNDNKEVAVRNSRPLIGSTAEQEETRSQKTCYKCANEFVGTTGYEDIELCETCKDNMRREASNAFFQER